MKKSLFVGTRKGLITIEKSNQWQISRTDFLGEPVSMVLPDKRDNTLYCALNLGHFGPKLHRSSDFGKQWEEIAAPAFANSNSENNDLPSVSMIWSLETGGNDEPDVLWAGTLPGALFRSQDRGNNWTLISSLWEKPERAEWQGGGYDTPGIHSICVDPRNSAKVHLGISCGGVWFTEDRGETWSLRANGMRAAYLPPERAYEQNTQDPHRVVACRTHPEVMWSQHHNGIFRTTDGGHQWQEIENVPPSAFGFAVVVHPNEPDTAWFVPAIKDQYRVPVDQRMVVTRTRDGGRHFDVLSSGLPQAQCYDLVYRHGLAIDDSGQCLAMGTTTGNLWISEDQGDTWQLISNYLPPISCVRFG